MANWVFHTLAIEVGVTGKTHKEIGDVLRNFTDRIDLHRAEIRPGDQWDLWDGAGNVVGQAKVSRSEEPVR